MLEGAQAKGGWESIDEGTCGARGVWEKGQGKRDAQNKRST